MSKKQLNISKFYEGDQRKRKFAEEDDNAPSTSGVGNCLDNSELRNYAAFQSKIRKRSSLFERDISRSSIFTSDVTTADKTDSASPSTSEAKITYPLSSSSQAPLGQFRPPKFDPSLLHSPFYPGPTMYGGAGAYKLSLLQSPSLDSKYRSVLNQGSGPSITPHRKMEQIKVKSSACQDNSMSQTAKRIYNLLEEYSSPLRGTRGAYLDSTSPYSPLSYLDRMKNNSRVTLLSGDTAQKQGIGRLPELSIPTIPDLIVMRRKRQKMDETTEVGRQIAAAHSNALTDSPSSYTIRDNTIKPMERDSNVIRTKISRKTGPKVNIEETLPLVNLPNISLPTIKDIKLPAFNLPKPMAVPKISDRKEVSSTSGEATKKRLYEFAKPLTVGGISKNVTAKNNFVFSRPLSTANKVDKKTEAVPVKVNTTPIVNFKCDTPKNAELKPAPAPAKDDFVRQFKPIGSWDCKECWVPNKAIDLKCVACGTAKPVADNLKKIGSVVDYFKMNSSEKVNDTPSLSASQFVKPGSWSCKECWVSNKGDDVKCAACNTSKPGVTQNCKSIESPPKKIDPNPLSACIFNKTASTGNWSCGDCWVSNKATDLKCVACGGAKPTPKPTLEKPQPAENHKKPTSTNWECKDCWVINKPDANKCIACGGIRFENPPAATFLNGPVKPAVASIKDESNVWKCPDCNTRNENTKSKCACCAGLKPSARKQTDGFKFSFSAERKSDFKFGIDKVAADSTTVAPAKIDFKLGDPAPAPAGGFKFGVSTTASVAAPSFTATLPAFSFGVKKDEPKLAPDPPIAVKTDNSDKKLPATGFIFGMPPSVKENKPEPEPEPVKKPIEVTIPPAIPKLGTVDDKEAKIPETKFPLFNSTITTTSDVAPALTAPTFTFGANAPAKPEAIKPTESAAPAPIATSTPAFSRTFGSASAFKPPEKAFTFGSFTPTPTTTAADLSAVTQPLFGAQAKPSTPFAFVAPSNAPMPHKPSTEPVKAVSLFETAKKPDGAPPPFPSGLTFNFGGSAVAPAAISTKTETSLFSMPTTTTAPFASTVVPSTLFSAASKPAATQSDGLFKSSVGLFGVQAQSPSLGASTLPASNIFGASPRATLPSLPSTQPQPAFGMPSATAPTLGFGSPPAGTGLFGATANATPANEQRSTLFPSSGGGLFGTLPQANAAPPAGNLFGNTPAPSNPAFGSAPNTFGSPLTTPQNAAFNFGSAPSVPSVFSFGQSSAPPPQNATFQFGPSANAPSNFNSEAQPQFNFNVGASPTNFRSSQVANTLASRKVKQARRRMTPR